MIEFKFIRWKNFLSYGEVLTEIPLSGNKATLIIGDNGAGKSTMIDALCYGLYGKAFRDIATPQLINTVNSNHMEVEIEFKIGRHVYLVKRGLKPRYFEVYQDNKLLNQDASARDYQEILEKQILKINHKSFKQIIVLGSSSFIPFMQLKSTDRKEVIEDLLDIGIFSVMGMLLKDKVSGTNEQLSNIDSQLLLMDDRIGMIHENIDRLQSQQEDDIKARQQTIKQAEDQIAEIESTINELNKVITALEEQLTDIDRLKRDQNQATKIYDKMLSKVERLKKEVNFYKNNDTCPTCLQPMDENHKHNNIEQRNTESREVEVGADDLKKIIEDFDNKIDINLKLQKEITNQQHKIIDNQSIVNSKNMLINDLKQQLNIVQSSTKMIDADRKKLDILQNEREEIYRSKAELVRHKNTLSIATRLLKDTGIKSKIVKQYVPVINKLINKYLAAMDFYVQFELDEQFNETIKSRYRDQFSYASFSEGEKMRIDLALLFTWRAIAKLKNSASTNLLIMDEVFDSSLDSTGTDEFMKIVMDIVSDTNVYIISHKTDQLVDRFTNVIRFEKHKNFSRMVA